MAAERTIPTSRANLPVAGLDRHKSDTLPKIPAGKGEGQALLRQSPAGAVQDAAVPASGRATQVLAVASSVAGEPMQELP